MKKFFLCFILAGIFVQVSSAQTATLHINIANTTSTDCYLWIPYYSFSRDFLQKGEITLALDKQKTGSYTISLTQPVFINLYCDADSTRTKSLNYHFFLSPGDDVFFKADFNQKDNGIVVTGKGSNNNQPLAGNLIDIDLNKFNKDTLPNQVVAVINKQYNLNKKAFDTYSMKYKPSAAFIKSWQYNLQYYAPDVYYGFKEQAKYYVDKDAYHRNVASWNRATDSLFSAIKLSNDDALIADQYLGLLRNFLLREKERLWSASNETPDDFYKQWYNTNVEEGKKLFSDDMTNLLQEKIIHKYFTGKAAEYEYGVLFDGSLEERNPVNLVQIFERFKKQYPGSKYVEWFGPSIDSIAKRQQQTLSNEMVFVTDNGTKLNSFEDVLAITKGKTVLLDMWGTWCGPCRSEIEKNSHAIKAYFKGKDLDYLYIANYDSTNEKKWKELIAYFDLKGTHILSNEKLSTDIMGKVKGRGYPTYVILKKDGTYEQSKAGYPMKRDVLIKQLEEALAMK
ncbi:Thiol-disulfide isomerase or thioredoxin [Mucilaginibacter lappiensis]|uniref:Thiol-disulfide isomerase/thioredoxin n=1 Tax=Mucilaginibacter lappiensis TaxID=354630 RepID=A0ABR6PHC9_9SPHI|nr:TlpA disulfide reductase family protein [Mucilaginibacter lappiensis]MBB6108420.1 thiol-disulfide isomerase/thioredoxin [Mucilaginibacter lappiensis]SIQ38591.1 Thiol-disulfide isomerase or thioredoxin [Mucilaginibacter lappiensis]